MKTVIHLNAVLSSRNELNADTENPSAKLGDFIREARLQKGITQEQLAEKCGTNKAYISKVENNVKDIRMSSLKKIVEDGLDGQFNISITL